MLTLPSIDLELKKALGHENAHQVLSHYTYSPDYKKSIEQVGQAYETIKVRIHKQILREQNRNMKHG